jgi:hypothetical protein
MEALLDGELMLDGMIENVQTVPCLYPGTATGDESLAVARDEIV